jgi:hypothetical protein
MPHTTNQTQKTTERLSLAQAARVTGVPKAYLRELVDSGRLAVQLVPGRGEPKLRVSRSGLMEAGLVPAASNGSAPVPSELSEMLALVREQMARITSLEEQRFQLGAQLGAAMERVAALEQRIEALPQGDPVAGSESVEAATPANADDRTSIEPSSLDCSTGLHVRDAVVRLGEVGLQRSARIGSQALRRRPRLFGRFQNRTANRS